MSITREYNIVCSSCNGNRWIPETTGVSSSATTVCPACNGSGVITVKETIYGDDVEKTYREFNQR